KEKERFVNSLLNFTSEHKNLFRKIFEEKRNKSLILWHKSSKKTFKEVMDKVCICLLHSLNKLRLFKHDQITAKLSIELAQELRQEYPRLKSNSILSHH